MNNNAVRIDPYSCPVSPLIHLGASSWTHQFWKGQVYHRDYTSEKDFNLNSLSEYATFEPFRIVEIDSSFYAPPKEGVLAQYAALVPDDFKFTAKIWERLSIPVYPNVRRYGKHAGAVNDSFLNAQVFNEQFLPAFRNSAFKEKFASFLFQFPRMDPLYCMSKRFIEKLIGFLDDFPREFRVAFELRNPERLDKEYIDILNRYGAAHCLSQWDSMSPLISQMKMAASFGGLGADFYYCRLITPLRVSFDRARKLFEPFDCVRQRDGAARRDIFRVAKRAIEREIPAYIIINNRFEGNSPQTIRELQEELSTGLSPDSHSSVS